MSCKDEKELRRFAESKGWTFVKTKSGHWKGTSPKGDIVIFGGTPSGSRSYLNTRALLRRAGLRI
jgi:hypothetical protein